MSIEERRIEDSVIKAASTILNVTVVSDENLEHVIEMLKAVLWNRQSETKVDLKELYLV